MGPRMGRCDGKNLGPSGSCLLIPHLTLNPEPTAPFQKVGHCHTGLQDRFPRAEDLRGDKAEVECW